MSELQYVWYFLKNAKGENWTTEEKIRECAGWYEMRMGIAPNLCLANAEDIGETKQVDGIELRASKTVQPNNYWLTFCAV